MSLATGARPPPAEHQAAMDWAADFNAKIDSLPVEDLDWLWNDDLGRGPRMRAQLKRSAPQVLVQLATALRDRVETAKAA